MRKMSRCWILNPPVNGIVAITSFEFGASTATIWVGVGTPPPRLSTPWTRARSSSSVWFSASTAPPWSQPCEERAEDEHDQAEASRSAHTEDGRPLSRHTDVENVRVGQGITRPPAVPGVSCVWRVTD